MGASLNNPSGAAQYGSFLAVLREQGFNEGQNIAIDYRRTDDPRGVFASAAELMRSQVDLVVATGPQVALQAVIGASRSIPIVFLAVQYDPIARGYVSSLAHPGGNVTGIFYRQPELAAKQLEILVQAFPERSRLAVLYDADSADQFSAADAVVKAMPLQLRPLSWKSHHMISAWHFKPWRTTERKWCSYCQAANRAAANIEGHPAAAKFGQPGDMTCGGQPLAEH